VGITRKSTSASAAVHQLPRLRAPGIASAQRLEASPLTRPPAGREPDFLHFAFKPAWRRRGCTSTAPRRALSAALAATTASSPSSAMLAGGVGHLAIPGPWSGAPSDRAGSAAPSTSRRVFATHPLPPLSVTVETRQRPRQRRRQVAAPNLKASRLAAYKATISERPRPPPARLHQALAIGQRFKGEGPE
jgi:hypothetical protein